MIDQPINVEVRRGVIKTIQRLAKIIAGGATYVISKTVLNLENINFWGHSPIKSFVAPELAAAVLLSKIMFALTI